MDLLDERYWIGLLPWRRKNKPESKSAQIKFAPKLEITREDGWVYLELQLVNRSNWTVWVQEATVVLIDLDAKWQTAVSNKQARYEILQNVEPHDTLSVSLARTIYDAAGRPQAPYSCLVSTNVRYRVLMSGAMRSLKHAVWRWRRLPYSVFVANVGTGGRSNKSMVLSILQRKSTRASKIVLNGGNI